MSERLQVFTRKRRFLRGQLVHRATHAPDVDLARVSSRAEYLEVVGVAAHQFWGEEEKRTDARSLEGALLENL